MAARGKPSPAVYRRRRLVVGTLLALVLVAIGGGAWALVRGSNQPAAAGRTSEDGGPVAAATSSSGASPEASSALPTATPSAAPTAASATSSGTAGSTAEPTSTPTPTVTCDPAKFALTASTDKQVYGPTENPVLTLKVTNQNSIPCTLNVGTSQMEYLIVSGADRIFDSKDCQNGSADLLKTLAPGASETANFPWPRVRSTEGCKAVSVKPLPGTYVLTTSLGPLDSPKTVFELQ
ncbi:hypothetical protein [Sinomonas humi]|uniref:MucR family transcriptional regulator n=1 Tax=Sinomonas humi TaxID=1338436 RepID=A0A0B2AMA2_9MICC|nr:hypothetical protein [Sinomonas humi]KHL03006.1 hypothetical protein LK10_10545 [Sinomonas humi]